MHEKNSEATGCGLDDLGAADFKASGVIWIGCIANDIVTDPDFKQIA